MFRSNGARSLNLQLLLFTRTETEGKSVILGFAFLNGNSSAGQYPKLVRTTGLGMNCSS